MNLKGLLLKFLIWRVKHVSTTNFVLFTSGVIGIVAGLAAVTLEGNVLVL